MFFVPDSDPTLKLSKNASISLIYSCSDSSSSESLNDSPRGSLILMVKLLVWDFSAFDEKDWNISPNPIQAIGL